MGSMSDFNIFERLIDYGRKKLDTDFDDYAIEWLQQSDFIDSSHDATDVGKSLIDIIYSSQNP